jgi:putative ABC transport system ATP-binding protein
LLRRDRIGFIFQSFNLLPTMTAAENIVLPMRIAGRKPDEHWVASIVETVGLSGRLGHRPAELSGGQQQRVAAARALASKPEIVFADEPTGALDSASSAELLGFLRNAVTELGQTVVMVTHDPLAAQHADRAVILHEGRLMGEVAQPTAHGVLDALAALADTDVPADGARPGATPSRRSERKANSRWPSLRRRAARHT